MFSGITEEKADIVSIRPGRITVKTSLEDIKEGDSLMVEGVCLTAAEVAGEKVSMDIGRESLSSTALKDLRAGLQVNLERPLSLSSRIHGHIVYGHVMEVGKVRGAKRQRNTLYLAVNCSREFSDKLIEKGSIALNGVSLTVNELGPGRFSVAVVPQTRLRTNLGDLKPGREVNLEADMIIAAAKAGGSS